MASYSGIGDARLQANACFSAIEKLATGNKKVHLGVVYSDDAPSHIRVTRGKTNEKAIQIINQTISYYNDCLKNSSHHEADETKFIARLLSLQENLRIILTAEDLSKIAFTDVNSNYKGLNLNILQDSSPTKPPTPPLSEERLDLIIPADTPAAVLRSEVSAMQARMKELEQIFIENGRNQTPEMVEFQNNEAPELQIKQRKLNLYIEAYETLYEIERALERSPSPLVRANLEENRQKTLNEIDDLNKLVTIKKYNPGTASLNKPVILGVSYSDDKIALIGGSRLRRNFVKKPIFDNGFTPTEGALAGLQEVLGFKIDRFFGGMFSVPPAIIRKDVFEDRWVTMHYYVDGTVSLAEFMKAGHTLDEKEVRKMVLCTLLFGLTDAHDRNFLIREKSSSDDESLLSEEHPLSSYYEAIPIDLGRMLVADPLSPEAVPRLTTLLQCTENDSIFNDEEKKFFLSLKPEELVDIVKSAVNYEGLDPENQAIFDSKILHLQANLIMIQVALKHNLSARQLLTLKLVNLHNKEYRKQKINLCRDIQRNKKAQQNAESNPGEPFQDQTEIISERFLKTVGQNKYFDAAWSQATRARHKTNKGFLKDFKKTLNNIIDKEKRREAPFAIAVSPDEEQIGLSIMKDLNL